MIHLTTVRELSPEGFEESVLPFLKRKEHAEAFDRNVAKFNRWVERRGGPQGPAPAHGPVVQAKWHGSDGFDEARERKTREESPQGKKLMARLEEDLRKELKKAEKQAEEYRGRKKDAKQKKSPPKGDGKDCRSKKSRSARSRSHRKKGRGAKSTSRLRRRQSGRKDKSRSRRRRRRKKIHRV